MEGTNSANPAGSRTEPGPACPVREQLLKFGIFFLGTALIVLADQLTKNWAAGTLKGGQSITLIPDVLYLTYVENKGIAFGLFQNLQWIFVILTVLVLAFVVFLVFRLRMNGKHIVLLAAMTCLPGGAAGNMLDRVANRYVVDFIYFSPIDFPVFNVADIFVTVSCAALLLILIFLFTDADLDALMPARKRDAKPSGEAGETGT